VTESSLTFFPLFLEGTIHPSSCKAVSYRNNITHWDRGCFTAIFHVYKILKAYLFASIFAHMMCSLLCNYFVPDTMWGNITAGTYCKAACLQVFVSFYWSVIINQ